MPRQYNQFCALARSLDVVGERWTLLIVRELLLGPKRFTDLLGALPGIGRNLLAARLRELEAAGVLEHDGPAYALTARGRGLEDAVLALTRWEMEEMRPPRPGDERRPGWYALAMRAAFRPEAARGVDESYAFRVDGEEIRLAVRDGRATARHGGAAARPGVPTGRDGPAGPPAVLVETDLDTFLGIAIGALDPAAAAREGLVTIEGSRAALRRCLRMFRLPAPAPAG